MCGGKLLAAVVFVSLFGAHATASAQSWPQRPVRFIVPYSPGGGADTLVRIMTRGLATQWSQPIVVDNRPGGDATIGVQLTAQAPADGHTLVLIITSHAVHPQHQATAV